MFQAVVRCPQLAEELAQLVTRSAAAPLGFALDLIACTSRTGFMPSTLAITASCSAPRRTVRAWRAITGPCADRMERTTASMRGAVASPTRTPPRNLVSLPAVVSVGVRLEATALALARIMDNLRATSTQPAAAKVLCALLDKMRSATARGNRGRLAVVRSISNGDCSQARP